MEVKFPWGGIKVSIEPNISKLGDNVRRIRLLRDKTQQEIADEADISVAHFSNIERGKVVPGLKVIFRISRSLGCTIDELIFEDALTIQRKYDLVLDSCDEYEQKMLIDLFESLRKNEKLRK